MAKATGAAEAWGAGVTGNGVDVALIDSGVTPVEGLQGSDKVVNGPDLTFESQNPARRHVDTVLDTLISGLRDRSATRAKKAGAGQRGSR